MRKKITDIIEEYSKNFTRKEFAGSAKEIEQISVLVSRQESPRIEEVPSLNPLSVLILLAALDEKGMAFTKMRHSELQSEIAKRPRPSRQKPERVEVYKYWNQWKTKPELYLTQADFICDMQEKTGINRSETIREWIKSFASPNQLRESS